MKTVSNDNDESILNESKEINITSYSELVAAIKDAENTTYSEYKINLLPGEYIITSAYGGETISNTVTVIP